MDWEALFPDREEGRTRRAQKREERRAAEKKFWDEQDEVYHRIAGEQNRLAEGIKDLQKNTEFSSAKREANCAKNMAQLKEIVDRVEASEYLQDAKETRSFLFTSEAAPTVRAAKRPRERSKSSPKKQVITTPITRRRSEAKPKSGTSLRLVVCWFDRGQVV